MARRHGGDKRGNSTDRRRRKQWMVEHFGNGQTCPCHWCSETLAIDEIEADRIEPGGSYARGNVIPACRSCNEQRGDMEYDAYKALARKRRRVAA
jgi:5-methylcytosine-specific restriction endonuclease McrA